MFRDEVGQQIPVLCFWRTLVVQPAPLRSGHRFATERVFSHQARAFELLLDLRELERRCVITAVIGKSSRERHDESQSVLDILHFYPFTDIRI